MTLYLSPEDNPQVPLLALITGATRQLRVSAYALTWPAFVTALIAAHVRGVDVAVLVDSSQTLNPTQHALVQQLRAAGVPTLVGTSPAGGILHEKTLIADAATVATGSFNFSLAAPRQANVTDIVTDPARAAAFLAHWERNRAYIAAHPNAVPALSEEVL